MLDECELYHSLSTARFDLKVLNVFSSAGIELESGAYGRGCSCHSCKLHRSAEAVPVDPNSS